MKPGGYGSSFVVSNNPIFNAAVVFRNQAWKPMTKVDRYYNFNILTMTRFSFIFLFFILLINTGFLCNKKDAPADTNPPDSGSGIYSVYSAGPQNNHRAARLWKNGSVTALTDSITNINVYVDDVAVAPNGDVYVTGCECLRSLYINQPHLTDSCRLVMWKNNSKQILTQTTFSELMPNFVFITSSGDVYVAGTENNSSNGNGIIRLWKNEVRQNITDGTNDAEANCLFVSGNDVYIGGNQKALAGGGPTIPVLWKNGTPQIISTSTPGNNKVVSVQANGSDVYAAVQEGGNSAWVAKNGVKQTTPAGLMTIEDLFIKGSDLYVLGGSSFNAFAVYKNGVQLHELMYNGSSNNSAGKSLFVKDSDVYVSGAATISGGETGLIWKNGTVLNTLVTSSLITQVNAVLVR